MTLLEVRNENVAAVALAKTADSLKLVILRVRDRHQVRKNIGETHEKHWGPTTNETPKTNYKRRRRGALKGHCGFVRNEGFHLKPVTQPRL